MADELSELNFEQDLREILAVQDPHRWKIQNLGGLQVLVTTSSEKAPGEVFIARLSWERYPDEPPSLKFQDAVTGSLKTPTAWPELRGFRPGSLDACVNWTKEGFALHPEWRNDPDKKWNPVGNPLLRVIKTLQNELDVYFLRRSQ